MKRASAFRSGRSTWPVVTGLVMGIGLVAVRAVAQETPPPGRPPAKVSEAERARRLQARDRHWAEAERLANSGKRDDAVREAETVLAIEREVLGELSEDVAGTLGFLAQLHELRADWVSARKELQDVLALRERQPDAKAWRVGDARRDLADLERRIAMTPEQRQRAGKLPQLGAAFHGLYARGQYEAAREATVEALQITRDLLGEAHPQYAPSLNNLAMLYHTRGDHARAEPLYRQALEITKRAVGEGHPHYATSLNNLAALYKAMGDHARAEPLCRQALEIRKRALGEGHPDFASSLNNLAGLYQARGDHRQAESMLTRAMEIQTAYFEATGSALGERARLELLHSLRGSLDALLSVAQENGARPEALYRRVLDWKGASTAGRDDGLLARDRPELRPILEELASVRARLAHLAFTTPAQAQRDIWRQQIEALRDRKEDLEAELGRRGAAHASGKPSTQVGPAEVAAALPAGTALVDLFVYTHYSPSPGEKGKIERERRLLAFIVRRDRPVVCVRLGKEKPVTDAVGTWRQALQTHRSEGLSQVAAVLGRTVWEPLRPHLADARTVLVSPDGELMSFPFAALPGRQPGSYLIEDVAIGYVGSGRDAVAMLTAPGSTSSGGLLAAGAIDFQADPGRAAPLPPGHPSLVVAAKDRGGFAPLPGTRAEGELARAVFRRAFADQPAVLLTGAEPTEAEIKTRLDGRRWRAVHLGTHGFFESPDRVAALRAAVRRDQPFALAPKPGQAADDAAAFDMTPFLNSGVVLAGGGRAQDPAQVDPSGAAPPAEDGILTAEEVQSLDLRGTELVVLSACETGLGRNRYGQGVLGLQRAFHAAGARAVVASLWKVDDAATSVLMERFYTNLWVEKMPRLGALRQAQLAVLKDPGLVRARAKELARQRGIEETPEKLPGGGSPAPPAARETRSDPFLWAAFVLSGDGR